MQNRSWKQRLAIATLASTLCVVVVGLSAQGQEGPAQATPAKDGPKPLAFEFRDTPWDKVLDWLADNSGGIPVVGITKPQGTFNFISSQGKKYTLPQIIDILNRSLLKEKIIIVRSSTSYTVISNDDAQNIDTTVLPNLTVDDLEMDKPYDQQKYGQSELCQITFNLNNMSVDEAETTLTSRKGPFGKFQKIPKGNMLLVTDVVGNLRQMKKLLDKLDPSNADSNIEVFNLKQTVNGPTIENSIKSLYNLGQGNGTPVANAPKIQYDETQHKLLVSGDKVQLKTIRDALVKFGAIKANTQTPVEPGPGKQPPAQGALGPVEDSIRTIVLKDVTNASQYVDNLKYLLGSLRANPVSVTYEPLMNQMLEDARKGIKLREPKKDNANANELILEKQPENIDNKPGRADRPVFIATLSRTSGLMIGSDDPEALDFAEQLLTYLVKGGDEIYEVIQLKNSNAKIVRDTLDELINGKRQQNPMGMMMMPFGGGGGGRQEPLGPTVRIAADARTNSLLVRGPRQIVVTIKRFVQTELDVNNIDQKLQPKPRIIPLQHAFASDVVDVLKEIYREYIDQRGGGGNQMGMPFNPFMQQQQPQQSERSIRLSVAASKTDNSVILNCPDVLWEEVSKLIEELDSKNSDNDKSFRVVNVGKADPQMIRQALETITGKGTGTQGNQNDPLAAMRNAMMNRGFGGFGGMGGGFAPGGGGGGGGNNRIRGGGGGGGGGRQGGGGGGPGGGGGGRGGRGGNRYDEPPAILSPTTSIKPGGSDFFADRVKEDPRTQVTFDNYNSNSIVQVQAQTPADQKPAQTKPQTPAGQTPATQPTTTGQPQPPKPLAPRGDVTFTVMPDGQILLIGDPEDIKLVEEILNQLVKSSPSAETELRMFGLDYLDAASATNLLSQIFAKYNPVVKVIGNSGSAPAGPAGGARPGGFGPGGGGFGPGGGFGGGQFGQQNQGGLGGGGAAVQPAQPGNLLLLTISRQNAILIGAPKTSMPEIERILKMIDKPIDAESAPRIINLRRANAVTLAANLVQFYQQRYTTEGFQQNELRVQPDAKTNSLIVHAGPADLKEIMGLIEFFDKSETKVVNEVRIKPLRNASAAELATLLQQALSQALLGNTINNTTTTPGAGGFGANQGGGFNQPNIFGGQNAGLGGQNALGGANRAGQTGTDRKGVSLTFEQPGKGRLETGLLEDVGIYADTRTNRLVISAPPESIAMLEKLIDELDVPPAITADVKVLKLQRADATSAANTLQQIFLGQARTGAGAGGFGGAGAFGGLNQQLQQALNFSGTAGQGPQPIQPRFSIDVRTNSVIIAAGRGDMILAEVILRNLDSTEIRDRMFQVVRLKNNQAGNVATNLNQFFRNEITVLQLNDLTTFMQADREVTVVADASNNSLMVGASARYFPEVLRLIDQLDVELAQVAIQVLIAQVRLENSDEFGVEVGLQSPVLFDRSLFGNPPPVTTSAANPAIGVNGYNWNNISTTNSSNSSIAGSSIVGMRGLTNYSTGLTNPTTGLGGFVFSAASNSVNVLVRALRTQGRIEVLSRPQIVTRDNQQALISVGQQVPIVTGSAITNGILQNTVEQQQVGIILKVLPQISPDGRIVMRVEPQISKVSNSTVDIGNGVKGTIIDQTIASTTIDATDGKTVIIGGLITKEDEKQQRGIPWLGDLPYVGALFRYRSQVKAKTELLIILTPHIIRNTMDADRVFMDEARKMSWSLDDVQAVHGALPGASFLQQGCADNALPGAFINPLDQNYFAPNTTMPAPDEKLGAPRTNQPSQGTPKMPIPQPPIGPGSQQQQQQQPQSQTPGWLLPPGSTPPGSMPQMLQGPQGQYYQGQPQAPVNSVVTGLPPQNMTNNVPANYNQAGYSQVAQQQQPMQQAPQQQINGNWKTTVTYAQPGAVNSPIVTQTQEVPIRQIQSNGFGGGQQP